MVETMKENVGFALEEVEGARRATVTSSSAGAEPGAGVDPEVLDRASPLDTHPSAFPSRGAAYTAAFGLKTLVVRRHDGFELALDRSYADMAGCLSRARSAGGEGLRI